MKTRFSLITAAMAVAFFSPSSFAQGPELTSWLINTDGATGEAWINGELTTSNNQADVQLVQYSDANVYVTSFGIPRYATAPFPDGNPSQASMQDYLFQIPRVPEVGVAGGTPTGLGHTAVLINGVPTFNALDAFSYQNQGVWNQNAIYFENAGFDCAKGHPAMDPITITRCRRLSATASHQPAMSAMTIPAKRYSRLTLRFTVHLLAGRLTDIRFTGRLGTTVRTARAASFELKRDTASETWPTGPPCRMARFWRPTSTGRTSTK